MSGASTEAELRRKRLATLKAQLALKGYVLERLADGSHIVQKWGRSSRILEDLDAVAAFARMVGAA